MHTHTHTHTQTSAEGDRSVGWYCGVAAGVVGGGVKVAHLSVCTPYDILLFPAPTQPNLVLLFGVSL